MPELAVMDSSAVIAVIDLERGYEKVAHLMKGALLSSVNLAEVHTKLMLRGSDRDFAWKGISKFEFEICPFDEQQARSASEMIFQTRPFGLSLGDRACIALAIHRKAAVYTADRAWTGLTLPIEINIIR